LCGPSQQPPNEPTAASVEPTAASVEPGAAGETVVALRVITRGSATLARAPVSINGKGPFRFILDTGAATAAINQKLADELGLKPMGRRADVSGVTATQVVELVGVEEWALGDTSLPPAAIGALDFPDKAGSSGQIAGLLGSDQLSRFGAITLDYRSEELRFTPAPR
jgi:Aspartyl protease